MHESEQDEMKQNVVFQTTNLLKENSLILALSANVRS